MSQLARVSAVAGGALAAGAVVHLRSNGRHPGGKPAGEADGTDPRELVASLEASYRRGRKAFRRAYQQPTPENLDRLRRRSEQLEQAARRLEPIAPRPMRKLADETHELTRHLELCREVLAEGQRLYRHKPRKQLRRLKVLERARRF